MGERGVSERDRFGRERNQLCGEPARGCDADLLAKDGADGDLEGVPAAGRAQAGLAAHDGAEGAIAREMRGDGLGVGVKIEDAAQARCDDGQRGDVIAGDLDLERSARGQMAYSNQGGVAIDTNNAAIDAVAHLFNAGDGARSEEGEQRVPVEGRAIRKSQDERGGRGRDDGAAAQLAGRPLVEREEGVVEAADASEAGGHGNRCHGQAGFVQKLLGEENAARLRNGQGRCADVLIEETAELTLAYAERGGKAARRTRSGRRERPRRCGPSHG